MGEKRKSEGRREKEKGRQKMKRILVFITAVIIIVVAAGCGVKEAKGDVTTTQEPVESGVVEGKNAVVDVDVEEEKGKEGEPVDIAEESADITLNIPAKWLGEDITQEYVDGQVQESGCKSGTLNEDGSVTYVMTKKQHKKITDDLEKGIEELIESRMSLSGGKKYVSITANDDYTEFVVVMSVDKTDSYDFATDIGFSYLSKLYSVFRGEGEKPVTIKYVNEDTNSVISENTY